MKDYREMADSVLERRDRYCAQRQRSKKRLERGLTGAACCCAAVLLCAWMIRGGLSSREEILSTGYPGVEELQTDGGKETAGTEPSQGPQSGAEDAPAAEPGITGGPAEGTVAFFGGSYMDDSGKLVVVLTVDTPENRAAVCKALKVRQSNTLFQQGDYTLDYLTQLQERISSAMAAGELPFVTSSGVYETVNRIQVTVTDDRTADLEKLLALDTMGGAIQVVSAEAAGTEEAPALE